MDLLLINLVTQNFDDQNYPPTKTKINFNIMMVSNIIYCQ